MDSAALHRKRVVISNRLSAKKVGTHVNPADLVTKPLPRPKIEQLMNVNSYRFVEQYNGQSELDRAKSACRSKLQNEVCS